MTKEQIEEAAKEYSGLTDNPKDSDSREKGSRTCTISKYHTIANAY